MGSQYRRQTASEVDHSPVGSVKSAVAATIVVAVGALAACLAMASVPWFLQQGLRLQIGKSEWQAHHLLSAIIIALANNVDNLGARIAYSIQGTRVDISINLWISVITFFISALVAFSGFAIVSSLGKNFAAALAMSMLVSLGLWMIIQASRKSWHEKIHEPKASTKHRHILRNPHHADIDDSRHIDFKEGTILGVALSLNNVGGGMSAGVLEINPLLVGALSALISFMTLFAGNYLASYFIRRRIADKAAVVGGIALILIGIKQIT